MDTILVFLISSFLIYIMITVHWLHKKLDIISKDLFKVMESTIETVASTVKEIEKLQENHDKNSL